MTEQASGAPHRETQFLTTGLPPNYAFPIFKNDVLQLVCFANQATTFFVQMRILLPDNRIIPWVERFANSGNRIVQQDEWDLPDGHILSAIVRGGLTSNAQAWAVLQVLRGNQAATDRCAILCQGHVGSNLTLSFPATQYRSSQDGRGHIRNVTGANPAANTEIVETVPAGALWRLMSARASLVADANVANRRVTWIIDDGATELYRFRTGTDQTAAQTVIHQLSAQPNFTDVGGTIIHGNVPPEIYLPAGFRLQTSTANRQVGDDWSAPQLWVEEWLLV